MIKQQKNNTICTNNNIQFFHILKDSVITNRNNTKACYSEVIKCMYVMPEFYNIILQVLNKLSFNTHKKKFMNPRNFYFTPNDNNKNSKVNLV